MQAKPVTKKLIQKYVLKQHYVTNNNNKKFLSNLAASKKMKLPDFSLTLR